MSNVLDIKKKIANRALAEWADTLRDINPEELYIMMEEIGDLNDSREFTDSND